MRKKTLCLPILTALFAIIFLSFSGFANAAIAPAATPLGYYTLQGSAPARIASDRSGKIYVTDANSDTVRVYSNNGVPLMAIRVNNPLGIAVDQSGRIFVGSTSDGSVLVFDNTGKFLYKLGSGGGEFGMPNDIAISSAGTVYVTDSKKNLVKAYALSGAPLFSFGGVKFPTGIAVDDAAGEVYVSDHNSNMIRIFNLNGVYKRYISGGSSRFIRPQGIALDSTRVYIADAYNSTVVVYGKDGVFLKYMGNYGQNIGEFRTPLDVAIDRDNKVFVANHNNSRIEAIGVDNYSQFNINPSILNFSGFESGLPITQTVNLTSTKNATGWVASASNSWVSVSPSTGATPSDVTITVNPAGLGAGNYTAQVMFSTASGTSAIVMVNLEVKPNPKTLYVAPTNMSFKYQLESPVLPSGNIVIASTGGSLSWTASPGVPWIGLSSTSGLTPSNIKLRMTDAVNALSPGTYNAKVIVDGGSAQGSPATINVSLTVINAGTVKVVTNLEQAEFDIIPVKTGTSYSGTGTEWTNDEVTPGDYTISFKHITGYIKPATKTFKVQTGKETTIDGRYRTKPVATHIIAGSGGTKGKKVEVLTLGGKMVTSFEPFTGPVSIKVAAGDLDGSGIDKIVVTDHKKTIKVYTFEGIELATKELAEGYTKSEIAVADIDNDGSAEIIVGVKNDYDTRNIQREIKLYKYINGKIVVDSTLREETGTLYTESKDKEFTIAVGDINGDGTAELLMADNDGLRAFSIDLSADNKVKPVWTNAGTYQNVPQVAAGDINDDGTAEIALSIETDGAKGQKGKGPGIIKILKGTGEDYKSDVRPATGTGDTSLTIEAFKDLGYAKPSTVAFGDMDGDGADEIIAGAGQDEYNEGLIRVFENNGTFTNTTIKTTVSKFGVNVSLGRFK